jgi:hypothetical protein
MVSHSEIERQNAIAQKQVARFEQRYGKEMLDFACHAAFPLMLTTDLVYLLRQDYFPGLNWSVAAELLLSNLCDVAGYDLYAMSVAVRRVLLDRLIQKQEFGEQRVEDLARWMATYIQHRLESDPSSEAKALGHPSEWTALACLRSADEVTQRIKAELGKLLAQTGDPSERFRLSALMESLGDLLAQRGLEPLKLRELAERFENDRPLDEDGESIAEVRSRMEQAGFPELKTAEIEYATIAFIESIVEDNESLQPFGFETVIVDARGREIERVQQEAYRYVETLPDGLNLEMVAIPSGTFLMGSPKSELERYDEESPQHQVTNRPALFYGTVRGNTGAVESGRCITPSRSSIRT